MPDQDRTANIEEMYNSAINEQRDYLMRLQDAFNKHCDEIAAKTADKLKGVPESDEDTRRSIYAGQKAELDEALATLKREIEASSTKTRKKLEEINKMREAREIKELEAMMQQFEPAPDTKDKKKK